MPAKNKDAAKIEAVKDDRILLWCNYCGQKYRLRKELVGKTGTCDECQNDFLIPSESQTKAELKKSIIFSCKHCSKKLLKPQELAGKEVTCHECGKKNIVPEAIAEEESPLDLLEPFVVAEMTRTDISAVMPTAKPEDDEEKILFWCNHCGQKYRLPQRLHGKTGVCPKCQNYLFIPHVSENKPKLKKTISFPCKHCGKIQLKAQDLAGTESSCYSCAKKNIIPKKAGESLNNKANPLSLLKPFIVAESTIMDIALPDDKILFWCSHCGQKYRLPRYLDGKAGICTKCQNYLFIPHVSQSKPKLEKTVVFPCKYCGQKIRKSRKLIGEETKCDKCRRKIVIPAKSKISSLARRTGSKPEKRILFWCSYCAQKYSLPEHLAGKSGKCDKCQKAFVIPPKSQVKAELRSTIVFPCEHCGKELWEASELVDTDVKCVRCGQDNIVPEKSIKSSKHQLDSEHFFDNPTDDPTDNPTHMVGDPIITDSSRRTKAVIKLSSEKLPPVSAPLKAPGKAESKKQIIITDNPPTVHKIKNYLHAKAEKYFIFAILVILVDHIIDRHESGQRLSKSFILFCTFTVTAIILLGSWNFAMGKSPDAHTRSRYNISCQKCGHHEIRRFKDITKQTCEKCASTVGFTYHCNKCKKNFACEKAGNTKDKEEDKPTSIRCPFCHSEDTIYLTIKKNSKKKK